MTETNFDEAGEARRKRARFRAWHRGLREADLILGPFADAHVPTLDEADLAEFEDLLDVPDADLLRWVTGELPVPAWRNTPFFQRIAGSVAQRLSNG